jgi:hypothetical protein
VHPAKLQELAAKHIKTMIAEAGKARRIRRRITPGVLGRQDPCRDQHGRDWSIMPGESACHARTVAERRCGCMPRTVMSQPTVPASPAAGQPLPGLPAGRRPEFDVMRAFVVAGLVVFHSAVVFAAGMSWFVNDPRPSAGFTVFLLWGSLWGMPLLFLVSGMAARYAMRTRSAAAFARERLARLGVPFMFGLVVLVPPMFYLGSLANPDFHEPYWRFWLSFVNVPAIARGLLLHGSWTSGGVNFDPAHLWFLYVLLVFSIVLLPLLAYLRRQRGRLLTGRLAGLADRHSGIVVWAAAIPMMAVEAVFGPDVNTGGWERTVYAFPFVYGFVIASDPRFQAALQRCRWSALVVACAATGRWQPRRPA